MYDRKISDYMLKIRYWKFKFCIMFFVYQLRYYLMYCINDMFAI